MGNLMSRKSTYENNNCQNDDIKITYESNNLPQNYDEIVNLVAASFGDKVVLPGDLVVQILSKLPVKSLGRFKTVCKPWNLLINSPVFIDIHLHRKNPQIGGWASYMGNVEDNSPEEEDSSTEEEGCSTEEEDCSQEDNSSSEEEDYSTEEENYSAQEEEEEDYSIQEEEEDYSTQEEEEEEDYSTQEEDNSQEEEGKVYSVGIVGACNGIICLKTSSFKRPLFLFNNATKEGSFIPEICGGWDHYGFYYNSRTHQYQIISMKCQHDLKVHARITTLGKRISLRDVEGLDLPGYIYSTRRLATSGTSMVWLGDEFEDDSNNESIEIVICYDLVEERFSKLNLPPSLPPKARTCRCLRVLKNSVVMFVYPKKAATFFDIWTLIEDGSKDKTWTFYRKVGPLGTDLFMTPVDVCWNENLILCHKYGNKNRDNFFFFSRLSYYDPIAVKQYVSSNLFYYDLERDQVEDYKQTDPPMLAFVNTVDSLVSIDSLVPYLDKDF